MFNNKFEIYEVVHIQIMFMNWCAWKPRNASIPCRCSFLFWYKMNQLVICLVVGLHTCSFSAEICCGSLQSKYAVRFTFILFLIILFYNVQMLAFHVSSRASRQRSWKKHSSSSLELVLGVMKPFRLILFVCVT